MRLWNWIVLAGIIAIAVLSVITVWPSQPDRYLPDAIPWPEGKGIKFSYPTIKGASLGLTSIERRAMSLGLDLRGGTRLVMEPEEGIQVEDLDSALDGAVKVIERRVNEFGVAESEVNRLGDNRIAVQLPGINPEEAIRQIGRTALLQFCEPVVDDSGSVAILQAGVVRYQPQTCQAVLDEQGNIVVDPGESDGEVVPPGEIVFVPWARQGAPGAAANPRDDDIVWKPASGIVEGVELALNGEFLRPNTSVQITGTVISEPTLFFEFRAEGVDILEQVTERLVTRNYPLAPFLDGEPIRDSNNLVVAPEVTGVLTTGSGIITGLDLETAQDLSTLLNTGAFPIALRIIQQQDVDATLGDAAVRNSVIAGEIALLLIMAFMVLYYRLPGLLAALALIVYTSIVLAIFKIWPVTLTLAGVGAFVLSVGIAVDANILIFERMKEELRVGRNLVVSLEDGFSRAWSSIRDSNIATFIICIILFWFGDQFDESAIRGFAITLGIGVAVSMFSAITVTRTFMLVAVSNQWLARRLWLFTPDAQDTGQSGAQGVPAVAGGSGGR